MTETSQATVAEKKDVVPSQYRDKYKDTGGTCGDFIAVALQKVSKEGTEGLTAIKAENNIEADRWSTFNPGMQRMNLANVLRGRFLKGETITVLGKQYNAKHMVERDFNGKVHDDHKTLTRVATFLELQTNDRTIASLQSLFFPKAKGPTAEEREKAKAEKAAAAAEAKAAKDAEKAAAKAEKAEKAAAAKAEKAEAVAAAKAEKDAAKAAAKAEKDAAAAAAKADKAAAQPATA